jgi:predicted DNA-binding transcriptional regulator
MSKTPHEFDQAALESALKGKTLLVYWYLVQQPTHSVGVREVQRALHFSSPSIAVHHLEKLQNLGLVDKKGTGEYVLEAEVKVGILRFFTRVGRFLVPRYLFYSVLDDVDSILDLMPCGRSISKLLRCDVWADRDDCSLV